MARVIRCYVDDATEEALERASLERSRSVEDLAEAAIAEAARESQRPRFLTKQLPLQGGSLRLVSPPPEPTTVSTGGLPRLRTGNCE